MQTQQLYVNDQLVDLIDDPLPYILQISNIADPSSIQGATTKQFKLPLTARNRLILGFPDSVQYNTGLSYNQLPARYIVDGVEVISFGILEITSAQSGVANVTLLAGNVEFLDSLQYQIKDMGDSLSPASGYGRNKVWDQYSLPVPNDPKNILNCVWDVAHAAASQTKTEGWIWPVIDWGEMPSTTDYSGKLNVLGMRPAFFLKTAMELLVQSTGYRFDKINSSVYSDPKFSNLYDKILIPCCNETFEHGIDHQNAETGTGPLYTLLQQYVIQHDRDGKPTSSTGFITFDKGIFYAPVARTKFTAKFTFDLYLRGVYVGSPSNISNITFYFNVMNADGTSDNQIPTPFTLDERATIRRDIAFGISEYTFKGTIMSSDFELLAGQKLSITYTFNHIGLNPKTDTLGIVYAGATLLIELDAKQVLYGENIECEMILPDMGQLDLLKDTMQGFGLLLFSNPNNRTISLISYADIVENIPIALDWSHKCIDAGSEISYQLSNLSQVNHLRYTLDTGVDINLIPKYFADDQININDKTLNPNQAQQDLFVRPWAPTRNRNYYGGTTAEIIMIDRSVTGSGDAFSIGVAPRLLIDQKIDLRQSPIAGPDGGPSVIFNNGVDASEDIAVNDILSVPYFYKPDGPDLGAGAPRHLAWKDMTGGNGQPFPGLRSVYYPEFQQILDQAKIVTRYFILSPIDIAGFNFKLPIYLRQDNAYFAVNKIDSWIKNKPCKVELLRL